MSFLNGFLFFLFMIPLFLSVLQNCWARETDRKSLSYINLACTLGAAIILSGVLIGGEGIFSSWKVSLFSVSSLEFKWGGEINETSASFLLVCFWLTLFSKLLAVGSVIRENMCLGRFFFYSDLFLIASFITISATHFIPLFFGWELLGIVAYLLLAFSYESSSSNQAAFTAFLYDKAGSIFLLLGGAGLIFLYGDISFVDERWYSIRHGFIGIFFFISIYAKLFQFGVNTWVSRSEEVPPLSLAVIGNFLYGVSAFILLWKLQLLQSSLLKTIALYLGMMTLISAAAMALIEPLLKKITTYLTIACWGIVLIFSTFGAYQFSFNYILSLSIIQFVLFSVETVVFSKYKEPIHVGKTSFKCVADKFCVGLILMAAVAHTLLLGAMGRVIFDTLSSPLLWLLGISFSWLSMAIWKPVLLLSLSLFKKIEKISEDQNNGWWDGSFLAFGMINIMAALFYFWVSVRSLRGYEMRQWLEPLSFVGGGIVLMGGRVLLFSKGPWALEKNKGYHVILKQAYLEIVYKLSVVRIFKWLSNAIAWKIDQFLIEEQAFTGSISALKRAHRFISWFQEKAFSFHLFFLLLGCLGLLFFFVLR